MLKILFLLCLALVLATTQANLPLASIEEQLVALNDALDGSVLFEDTNNTFYEENVLLVNPRVQKTPAVLFWPNNTADVALAVEFLAANNLKPTVKSGGHNQAGACLREDGYSFAMSGMRSMSLDAVEKTLWVESGIRCGDMWALLNDTGLHAVCGSSEEVGVFGLTLGGGYGLLSRSFGLAQDNVLEFEMVDYMGNILSITENNEHADLFWALRGAGGGNFGIVTRIKFQLHAIPKTIYQGTIAIFGDYEAALVQYDQYVATEMIDSIQVVVFGFIPQALQFVFLMNGDDEVAGRAAINPLLDRLDNTTFYVLTEVINPFLYTAQSFSQGFDGDANDPFRKTNVNRQTIASSFVSEMDAPMLAEIIPAMTNNSLFFGNFLFGVIPLGGRTSEIAHSSSAFAYRHARYDLGFISGWGSSEDDEHFMAIINDIRDNVKSSSEPSKVLGNYVNYMDYGLGQDEYLEGYYGDNVEKLIEIKTQVDPMNMFTFQQGIPVAIETPTNSPTAAPSADSAAILASCVCAMFLALVLV